MTFDNRVHSAYKVKPQCFQHNSWDWLFLFLSFFSFCLYVYVSPLNSRIIFLLPRYVWLLIFILMHQRSLMPETERSWKEHQEFSFSKATIQQNEIANWLRIFVESIIYCCTVHIINLRNDDKKHTLKSWSN